MFKTYSISFRFHPTKFDSKWTNVIRFTNEDRAGGLGRTVTVFVEPNGDTTKRNLQIDFVVNGKHTYFRTKGHYQLLQWVYVSIDQFMRNGKYYWSATINSVKEHEVEIDDPQLHKDVTVYTSDKFFVAQEAHISHIKIKSGKVNFM